MKMNLIQCVLLPLGITKHCKTADKIFNTISVSVLAIVWLSLAASMFVFTDWKIKTFVAFGLVLIAMEFRILHQMKTNIEKIVEGFNYFLQQERVYSFIDYGKINFGIIITIVLFLVQLCLNVYFSCNSIILNEIIYQAKYFSLIYIYSMLSNFYVVGLINMSIYVCFEIRRRINNLFVRKFLYDKLSENKIISRVKEFLEFYNNSRLNLLGYIEPIEKSNMITILFLNILMIIIELSSLHYNDSLFLVLLLAISQSFIDLYYLITNYFIMKKKSVTSSLVLSMSELKRNRQNRRNMIALATMKEKSKQKNEELNEITTEL